MTAFAKQDFTDKACEIWRDLWAQYEREEISREAFKVAFRAVYNSVTGFAHFDVINPIMEDFEREFGGVDE